MDTFNIGIAAHRLVTEFWHTFCDICIEEAKPHIYPQKDPQTKEILSEPNAAEEKETRMLLLAVLREYLKMLHPFVPHITEQIWQAVRRMPGEAETLMYAKW
jgi:valyl-tRNA synthetase